MALLRQTATRLPSKDSPDKPSLLSRNAEKPSPRLAFFRWHVHPQSNSSVSVPLSIVLIFPCLVIILICILFMRSPDPQRMTMTPAGTPPSFRHVLAAILQIRLANNLQKDQRQVRQAIFGRLPRATGKWPSRERRLCHIGKESGAGWCHTVNQVDREAFQQTFREKVENHTSSPVEWGKIEPRMWGFPNWVDQTIAKEGMQKQGDAAIMYGGMESYHHMCRFYSGFFYKHELLQKYEWYWRLEPEVKYFCDITYDPFIHMIRNKKTYGFTIAMKELRETVPNIFRYAAAYKRMNNITSQGLWEIFLEKPGDKEGVEGEHLRKDDAKYREPDLQEIRDTEPGTSALPDIDLEAMEGEAYNMCHFWSNFEIARLSWFRSKEYNDFFDTMDRSGGFWMERWGDAPIHSLAAGALLGPADIHYFRDFGYRHSTIQHCPANAPARQLPRIPYLEKTTVEEQKRVEDDDYWATADPPRENGVGCRCKCDTDIVEVESKPESCLAEWVEVVGGWASP